MTSPSSIPARRRERDPVQISGDYQARALVSDRMAQRFWHEAKFRLIDRFARPAKSDRVLDAGCGSGTISRFLAARAAHVVGADSNPEAIAYARSTYHEENLEFCLGQFDQLLGTERFDWIYCVEVVEHLYEEQVAEVLSLFRRLAKPRAKLFLTTPNYRSLWPLIEWFLDRLGLVPALADEQHICRFTKDRLRKACEHAGWEVLRIGTFNTIAPFMAIASRRGALYLEKFEQDWSELLPGNLLYCVCENRDPETDTGLRG